ncbi:FH2 domain-containing protein 1 [Nibea albiflora]|uniref:FH2 domain-containing protein 1 n=1 Tax=Nibea albiflora TaxID=240163 RepID=A0ACB7F1C7_NIBAL|nr:FH2 domain-containing protein 1 [Nibea albiflora]
MCVTTHAPPPLPPPPPPPPPPPLLPPAPFGSRNSSQRRSMKKLNWDTIPSQRVLGKLNVWTSKRPQKDIVLDIQSMEELFSHIDKRASLRHSRVMGLNYDGMEPIPQEPQVTILDFKKSMNIAIFLRHFKRPVAEIVQDICQGNWLRFGTGKLKELCKLLPDESEVKQLLSFSGNLSVLPEADQFMVQLVKVPGYEERLKVMVLREEFFPLMEEVKNSVAVMTKGANELLDCDDLHSVIRLVLKAGNYMNVEFKCIIQGGYSDDAIGFRMASLLKLADTKANKPGMNLMHYVAKQAEDIGADLLTFPSQLKHIEMASRWICKEEVITDFKREVKKIKEVKMYTSRHPALLRPSWQTSESSLQELKALSDAVAEYFCEDPATFKLEECCSIFDSFCKRFNTAIQENREREAAEQRRKRKGDDTFYNQTPLHNVLPRQKTPEKKQSKLQREEMQSKEAEKLCEKTRKVLRNQNSRGSLDGDRVSGTPCRSESTQDTPATPSTPQPRTRDFFFANNGDVGSPWTILSPFTCSQRNQPKRNKKLLQRARSSPSGENDLDDGVWESDKCALLPSSPNQDNLTSPSHGSVSLPECPSQRAMSQGPILRSASMDETRKSPASPRSRLGGLFQRSTSRRSFSSGTVTENMREERTGACAVLDRKLENHVEGQVSNFGLISFFRRIGGRSKPDVEEQTYKESNIVF